MSDKWAEKVAEVEPLLRERAKAENTSVTAAAIHWAKEIEDPHMALLVMSVAVEIKPEPVKMPTLSL